MSLSYITVKVIPHQSEIEKESYVWISRKLMKHLKIDPSENLKILIGKISIHTKINVIVSETTEIQMPINLLQKFGLPIQNYNFLSIYLTEQQTLWLGPIIGLVTDFSLREDGKPHFGSVHSFCSELHQTVSAVGGFFYVFKLDQFPRQGYYLEAENWVLETPPIPDCIYNRIHSRKWEFTNLFTNFRLHLRELGIPLFNDRFLSKWEIHEQLTSEPLLSPYIPNTVIMTRSNFYDFVRKFQNVFIKPVHGSQGRNIIKVQTIGENLYTYQTSNLFPSSRENETYSLDELYRKLSKILEKHHPIFLLQQGISLLTLNNRPMDFRVLCHKNFQNNWKVTSMIARIGGQDEFVSNLARGGTIMRPLEALHPFMDQNESVRILEQIKELAVETAETISRHSEGITGELGIDIGADITGKPWLIEVNLKPSKTFEDSPGKIRPSARAIIQFCTKLAFDSITKKEFE